MSAGRAKTLSGEPLSAKELSGQGRLAGGAGRGSTEAEAGQRMGPWRARVSWRSGVAAGWARVSWRIVAGGGCMQALSWASMIAFRASLSAMALPQACPRGGESRADSQEKGERGVEVGVGLSLTWFIAFSTRL